MRDDWVAPALLWLGGVGLRLTILAVPPVIALIQTDLNLSGTEIGILSGLPVILFAIAALPGSLLIARFGALATLVAGLVIAGVGSGLRGALLDVYVLYAATIVMSAGIAIMQPAMSPLVRQWMPQRVSFGTALYSNGLLVAETIAVLLTIPVVMPMVDNSWRLSLAVWGVPLIVIAILTLVLAPKSKDADDLSPMEGRSWWPDWSNKLIWQIALVFGSINSVYFCSNAFLPGHLTGAGRPDLIHSALLALNFGQLPASFVLLAVASRLERRAWPFVLCGALMLLCIAGVAFTASWWLPRLSRRLRHDRRLCAAGAAHGPGRRGAHVGGDVHHQLQRGAGGVGGERGRLGYRRQRALRLPADCAQRGAAADRAGLHTISRGSAQIGRLVGAGLKPAPTWTRSVRNLDTVCSIAR
jgi:CP family cyanate transporter-like MFS transporter